MEARDKVTGSAKYTVDIHHDGQLEGVILRSPFAHARISELDLAPARAMPGVSAVISLLGDDRIVRYVGEPIAAVAASDRKTALAAIAAIKLSSERLPSAIGLDEARKADAPVVFEKSARKKAGNVSEGGGSPAPWKGNIRGPSAAFSKKPKKVRSWVDGARAANNPLLVEGTFRTGTQSHACLEPHAAVARFDGDRLTVHVSTQAVFHVMELIAKRYKLGHDKVRVIADHVGGGFGSKASLGVETTTAIELARAAKAPVRVAYDRHEELSVTGYRPAAEVKIALLPSEQGELKALSLTAHADTGAATNSTIAALARLIYPAEAKELADFDVISNLPAGAAVPRARRAADGVCAGTGDRRSGAAHERRSDRAAQTLGSRSQPPAAVRLGIWTWKSGATARPIAAQSGRYRRGVGVATGYWLYLWQPGSKVEVAVKGGRLIASTATQDIGTGTRTVIANTVAREFGLEPHEIEVRIGNSNLPEGPGSGGSRVTASVIPPMLLAIRS